MQRQPFGGWKRSSVGTTSKAGGPNYLTHLGTWRPRPLRSVPSDVKLSARVEAILSAVEGSLGAEEVAGLRAAATSDQVAWSKEFGIQKDVTGLGVERNVFRYLPVPVAVRGDGSLSDLVACRARGDASRRADHGELRRPASRRRDRAPGRDPRGVARSRARAPSRAGPCPRHVGRLDVAKAVEGDPDVAIYGGAVTQSGRIELLPFLREQAISITNHRFGNHDRAFDAVLPRS